MFRFRGINVTISNNAEIRFPYGVPEREREAEFSLRLRSRRGRDDPGRVHSGPEIARRPPIEAIAGCSLVNLPLSIRFQRALGRSGWSSICRNRCKSPAKQSPSTKTRMWSTEKGQGLDLRQPEKSRVCATDVYVRTLPLPPPPSLSLFLYLRRFCQLPKICGVRLRLLGHVVHV